MPKQTPTGARPFAPPPPTHRPGQPAAPPVYRPGPPPLVLQRKAAPGAPPPAQAHTRTTAPQSHARTPTPTPMQTPTRPQPTAPPAYRPQPAPRVLQTKTAAPQPRPAAQLPRPNAARPTSSPQQHAPRAFSPKPAPCGPRPTPHGAQAAPRVAQASRGPSSPQRQAVLQAKPSAPAGGVIQRQLVEFPFCPGVYVCSVTSIMVTHLGDGLFQDSYGQHYTYNGVQLVRFNVQFVPFNTQWAPNNNNNQGFDYGLSQNGPQVGYSNYVVDAPTTTPPQDDVQPGFMSNFTDEGYKPPPLSFFKQPDPTPKVVNNTNTTKTKKSDTSLWQSPGGTKRLESPRGTVYIRNSPVKKKKGEKVKKDTRRTAGGYVNPSHDHKNMAPHWEKSALSPIPDDIRKDEKKLITHLMKPERRFEVYSPKRTRKKEIKGHSQGVLGHDESAGSNWNREGHKRSRKKNLEYNRQTKIYHGIEPKDWSSQSGSREERYLSPNPLRGSHRSYWDTEDDDFRESVPWHTYTKDPQQKKRKLDDDEDGGGWPRSKKKKK